MGIKPSFGKKSDNDEARAPKARKPKEKKVRKARKSKKDRSRSKKGMSGFSGILKGKKKKEEPVDLSKTGVFEAEDSFGATIRSSEPIMKLREEEEKTLWKKEILLNASCGALITAFICLFLMGTDNPGFVPFALPAFVIFMVVTTLGSIKPGKVKWITAGVMALILIAVAIIWRDVIFGGLGMVINRFYDVAEEMQAYLYDRFAIGDSATDTDGYLGIAWISCVIGLLAALPPAKVRPGIAILLSIIAMFAFAYYGLIPSWVCIAILLVTLMFTISRGNVISRLAVILAVMIVFGAIVLIDPGENLGISRMDENFRDKFALKSAYLEKQDFGFDDFSDYTDPYDQQTQEEDYDESPLDGEYAPYFIIGIIAVIVLGIGLIIFLLLRRMFRRRAANREGIDSEDLRESVVAMFPYTVRWLRCYGVEPPSTAFISMIPGISREFSEDYARRFFTMYKMWSEAAYSDHKVSEKDHHEMDSFMYDTIDMVNRKSSFGEKLKYKIKYAL